MTPVQKIIVESHAGREPAKPEERANACTPAVYRAVHSRNISHIGAKQRAKLEARGVMIPAPTPTPEIPTPIPT